MRYLFILIYFLNLYSQEKATILGTIKNEAGDKVVAANISIPGTSSGAVSDENGSFIINKLDFGQYKIRIDYIGYQTIEKTVLANKKILELNFILKEDFYSDNTLIVSASRKIESIDEVPSAITVVGPKQISESKNISTNLQDILAITEPAIAMGSNTTSNTGQTLRGRGLLIMIDGIPQSTPLRNGGRDIRTIDPAILERVEIIKGATSIYGNGSDGGLINYITKQNNNYTKAFNSYTSIGSSGHLFSMKNSIGSKITQQFFGQKNKLEYFIHGGYEQNGVMKDADEEVISPRYGLGETEIYSGLIKLKYKLGKDQSFETMYSNFSSSQNSKYIVKNGVYGQTPTIGILGETPGTAQGTRYNHNAYLKYRSNNIYKNLDLDMSLYYQNFWTIYGFSTYFENGGQSSIKSKKFGYRANLNIPAKITDKINVDIITGFDFLNDHTSQELVDGRIWVPKMKMQNFAPYIQAKFDFNSSYTFKAGLRLENISVNIDDYKTIKTFNRVSGAYDAGGTSVQGGKLDYSTAVFNLGLKYNEIEMFKPFLSFSQGFSLADLGRTLRSAKENTVKQIKSEAVIVNNYEFGFTGKSDLLNYGGSVYLSTSELGSSYKEINGVFQIQRAPEQVYGYEFLIDLFLSNKLTFGASYSYVEGKADLNDNGDFDDDVDVYLPNNRISVPKLSSYVSYRLTNNLSAKLLFLHSFSRKRFDARTNGTYSYGLGPVNDISLFHLYTNYDLSENTKISLGIENLFNKDYYTINSQWYGRNNTYAKGNGTRFNISLAINY